MEIIALIISVLAMGMAIAAYIMALKNKTMTIKEIVTEVKEVKAPVEHPFIYDPDSTSYTLEGNLLVTGGVSCLETKKKKGK